MTNKYQMTSAAAKRVALQLIEGHKISDPITYNKVRDALADEGFSGSMSARIREFLQQLRNDEHPAYAPLSATLLDNVIYEVGEHRAALRQFRGFMRHLSDYAPD